MSLAMSELIQTAAVAVAAYVVLTLLALFLPAESARGKKPDAAPPP